MTNVADTNANAPPPTGEPGRGKRISLLFALLGALVVLALLFLATAPSDLTGITVDELNKRAGLFWGLMTACFFGAGWMSAPTFVGAVLRRFGMG